MAKQRSPKGAQSSQKPPISKGGSYQVRASKNSEKPATVSDNVGAYQLADPTKRDKGIAASALHQYRNAISRAMEKRVVPTISIHREGQIAVRLLSAKDQRPVDVAARVELRRMVEQLPAETLQQAIEALKTILAPGRTDTPMVASDAEVTAAADQFIRQYKHALDRLAKR